MANSIDILDAAVTKQLSDPNEKFSSVSKEQLSEYIDLTRQTLLTNVQGIDSMNELSATLSVKFLGNGNANEKTEFAAWLYQRIFKNLVSNAGRMEKDRCLSSFHAASMAYVTVLDNLNRELDNLFKEKTITLFNTKISHVAAIGMVSEAETFSKWVNAWVSAIAKDFCQSGIEMPLYLVAFLKNNVDAISTMINNCVNSTNKDVIVNLLKNFKNNGADVLLVGSENTSNVSLAKGSLSNLPDSTIVHGARGLGIFRWFGNWRASIRDKKMRRKKEERDLMQAQVDLMRLRSSGMDPNDPEYQRLVKLINNYTAIIAKYDRELDSYFID